MAGALMTEAQRLFDRAAGDCCPEQLRSPVLHRVLAYDAIAEHIWGGKGVGSQASLTGFAQRIDHPRYGCHWD